MIKPAENKAVAIVSERFKPLLFRRGLWLLFVVLVALALLWLPYLTRSNDFNLPVLDNLHNPLNVDGFWDAESNLKNPNDIFRWTKPDATMQLPQTLLPRQLSLNLSSNSTTAPTVEVLYDGQGITSFKVRSQPQSYKIEIPAQLSLSGGILELKTSPPLMPDKNDTRKRGVIVRGLKKLPRKRHHSRSGYRVCY